MKTLTAVLIAILILLTGCQQKAVETGTSVQVPTTCEVTSTKLNIRILRRAVAISELEKLLEKATAELPAAKAELSSRGFAEYEGDIRNAETLLEDLKEDQAREADALKALKAVQELETETAKQRADLEKLGQEAIELGELLRKFAEVQKMNGQATTRPATTRPTAE